MTISHQTFTDRCIASSPLGDSAFEHCVFVNCDFSRADLADVSFKHCQFTEPGAEIGSSFQYANLQDASFVACKLAMCDFTGANLFGAEFRQCDMKGANFVRAQFANYISQRSYFCSVFMTGCNLSYANFERQVMEKCELYENRWIGANLQGASLQGSDLSRGEFSADAWRDFSFSHCDLSHCELDGLDPRRLNVEGVKVCAWQQEHLLAAMGFELVPD